MQLKYTYNSVSPGLQHRAPLPVYYHDANLKGYQGSEKDDEVKGGGNSYTTEYRQLDVRLGRWLSIDPLAAQFPWQSPYVSMDNSPISLNDPLGLAASGDSTNSSSESSEPRKTLTDDEIVQQYAAAKWAMDFNEKENKRQQSCKYKCNPPKWKKFADVAQKVNDDGSYEYYVVITKYRKVHEDDNTYIQKKEKKETFSIFWSKVRYKWGTGIDGLTYVSPHGVKAPIGKPWEGKYAKHTDGDNLPGTIAGGAGPKGQIQRIVDFYNVGDKLGDVYNKYFGSKSSTADTGQDGSGRVGQGQGHDTRDRIIIQAPGGSYMYVDGLWFRRKRDYIDSTYYPANPEDVPDFVKEQVLR